MAKNKKNRLFISLGLFAISIFIAIFFIGEPGYSQTNQEQSNIIQNLISQNKNILRYTLDKNTNKLTFIAGRQNGLVLNIQFDQKTDPTKVADQFVKEYGIYFGLNNSSKELSVIKKDEDELGMNHVRYNQRYNGVPVLGGQMIVHLKEDLSVKSANGRLVPDISLDTQPDLNPAEASNKAKEYWQNQFHSNLATALKTNLYVLNKGLIENRSDDQDYLVWEIELYQSRPKGHEFYYIDAHTGELVYQISGIKDAIYRRIYDCTRGGCYLDNSYNGYIYGRSEGKPARGTNPLYGGTDVDSLYSITSIVHNYFYNTFSLNGANDLGGLGDGTHNLYAYTDGFAYIDYVGESCPNAYFDGYSINFCQGLVYTDVVAHEYTHGVDQFNVLDAYGNPSGLIYSDESGALNEAFSDIFGEAVENYTYGDSDWLMGADVDVAGLIGPLRDLSDPDSLSDSQGPLPDRFYSDKYFCAASCDENNDYCGVHHNSTVAGHAAYLMAEGGTFNGCTISGIGRTKEEAIFYRALTNYTTPSSGFNDVYNALLFACDDLYGLSSSDCQQAAIALQAVEMDQAGACSGVARVAPECALPAIIDITSNTIDGYYIAGDLIDIDVTFSTNVTSSAGLTLTFDSGGSCLFTIANADTATCAYTVAAGENSADLNVASVGGSITGPTGTTIFNPVPESNLADNKNLIIDTTSPTGSIIINSGAGYTQTGTVTLALSASDANGVDYMCFYTAELGWSAWESYNTTKSWSIDTSAQGVKTIYVQFSDVAGNLMAANGYDDIVYDTVPPITSVTPAHGKVPKGGSVTFTTNETATIYYTTDGSIPSTASSIYSSPITINEQTTFSYFAIDSAGNIEDYKTTTFVLIKQSFIITGAGPGGGPHVRGFNYAGTAQSQPNFFPFDKTFKGGVHLTACDVDADEIDEIIVGVGQGEEPWVKVLEKNGTIITQFLAYGKNIRGGVFVACGDLDGLDGRAEIITGVPEGFGPHVRVFDGETGQPTITNGFFAYGKNVRTGIRVAAGDLDGDGKAEIITGTGNGAGTQIRTFTGNGTVVFTPGFFVYDKADRSGIKVASGDVNGDGEAEIIAGSGSGKVAEIKVYDRYGVRLASFYPYGPTYKSGIKIASGDVDADGVDEIVAGTELGGGPQVRVFEMNGTVLGSFFAYDKNFRGGVDVAVGLLQ